MASLAGCCVEAGWDLVDKTIHLSAYQQAANDSDRQELVFQNAPWPFQTAVVLTFQCGACGRIEQIRTSSEDELPAYFGRIVDLLKTG